MTSNMSVQARSREGDKGTGEGRGWAERGWEKGTVGVGQGQWKRGPGAGREEESQQGPCRESKRYEKVGRGLGREDSGRMTPGSRGDTKRRKGKPTRRRRRNMTKKVWEERREELQADLRWGRKRRPEQTEGGGS